MVSSRNIERFNESYDLWLQLYKVRPHKINKNITRFSSAPLSIYSQCSGRYFKFYFQFYFSRDLGGWIQLSRSVLVVKIHKRHLVGNYTSIPGLYHLTQWTYLYDDKHHLYIACCLAIGTWCGRACTVTWLYHTKIILRPSKNQCGRGWESSSLFYVA